MFSSIIQSDDPVSVMKLTNLSAQALETVWDLIRVDVEKKFYVEGVGKVG